MKIEQLKSKEDAIDKGFKIHNLYGFPIKCNRCNSNVRINKDTNELFQCDCRFIIFNYSCGVHIPIQ